MSVLVLGLGNPLRGDDGVGPRVVEELTRRGLPDGVMTLDVRTGGLDLLHTLEGWKRVVAVDAADVGREPGQFVRFTPDQVRLPHAANRSEDGRVPLFDFFTADPSALNVRADLDSSCRRSGTTWD